MSAQPVPEYRELLAERMADLVQGYDGEDLAEAMWISALGVIDRATARTREWAWWRAYPVDELERLRERLAEAMRIAEWAARVQKAANEARAEESRQTNALAADLHEAAAQRARRVRRVDSGGNGKV